MTAKVNEVAKGSYDTNHQLYDKVRPGFIPAAVDYLVKSLDVKEGGRVVDLAAGTGKFTRAIADRGFDLVAVEPSEGMIASFRKNFPDIPCEQGDSYHIPLDDESADGITVAQAFHWFADHQSLKEIARVLKPGAKVALIWNYEGLDDTPENGWQRQVTNYVHSFDLGVPQYRHGKWLKAFENQSYFKTPFQEAHFKFEMEYKQSEIWPYWESRSYITALPEDKRMEVKAKIEQMIANSPDATEPLVAKRGVHVVIAEKQ